MSVNDQNIRDPIDGIDHQKYQTGRQREFKVHERTDGPTPCEWWGIYTREMGMKNSL